MKIRTRASAYGLAIHDGHILLTQLAEQCYRAGSWTLPGGGMDLGELPEQTVVREFFEETGLEAKNLDLFHVHSFSETERGPFMAIQIVYAVTATGIPVVQEVGGSTAACEWIALDALNQIQTVPLVDVVLKLAKQSGLLPGG